MMAPIVGMFFIIFSGYLITRDAIDPWFVWLYYLSPFSWSMRAFALIEFHSDKYNDVSADSAAVKLSVQCVTIPLCGA
jgi:ABC-type multidrug transport system permease subunit